MLMSYHIVLYRIVILSRSSEPLAPHPDQKSYQVPHDFGGRLRGCFDRGACGVRLVAQFFWGLGFWVIGFRKFRGLRR